MATSSRGQGVKLLHTIEKLKYLGARVPRYCRPVVLVGSVYVLYKYIVGRMYVYM